MAGDGALDVATVPVYRVEPDGNTSHGWAAIGRLDDRARTQHQTLVYGYKLGGVWKYQAIYRGDGAGTWGTLLEARFALLQADVNAAAAVADV